MISGSHVNGHLPCRWSPGKANHDMEYINLTKTEQINESIISALKYQILQKSTNDITEDEREGGGRGRGFLPDCGQSPITIDSAFIHHLVVRFVWTVPSSFV